MRASDVSVKSKKPNQYRKKCLKYTEKDKQNIAELEKNAAALGIKGLNALIKRKIQVPTNYQTPSGADFGIATKSTMEIFRKTDYFKLKPGLRCPDCYSPTNVVTGSKKRCISCKRGSFRRHTQTYQQDKIPEMKKEMRESTNQKLHHLAYIGRTSFGKPISQKSFKKLNEFAVKWMKLTHGKTYKTNVIDFFAGNGSGLASYETMTRHCTKGKDGFTGESMSDIVNRLQQVYFPGDKVTLVAYQISGITLKIQNLITMIADLKQAGIDEINFLFYGNESSNRRTVFAPYTISSIRIEQYFALREENDFIFDMKIGAYGRIFSVENGRNLGAIWMDYNKHKDLIDMQIEEDSD